MDYDPNIPRVRTWEKPPELDTRSRWEHYDRKIIKGQIPRAILVYEVTRKKFVGDAPADDAGTSATVTKLREVGLYAIEQTKRFRPTPRTQAIRELEHIYLRHSNRQHYLWNCEGKWISCNGRLSSDHFQDHLAQNAIYGVRGDGRGTRHGGIDLDLHNGDKTIFLEQLNILLEEFHGRQGWHYQVADQNAQGVHILQVLAARVDYGSYRAGLRARLEALDRKYPDLAVRTRNAGMKTLGELEIFPNIKNGLRLPFCRGRTMLIDGPLPKILVRGKTAVDVEKYIAWVNNVNNPVAYMPRQDVHEYISARLVTGQVKVQKPADINAPEPPDPVNSDTTNVISDKNPIITKRSGKLRGRYAQQIQEFWSGENTPPDSLNMGILLLANIAPYYFSTLESAVSAIEGMIDALDDKTFSDRLSSGNRAAVSRVVVDSVSRAFKAKDGNDGNDVSSAKLAATYRAWAEKGFNPFDKSTWAITAGGMKLGPDFHWTDHEKPGLDSIQTILKTDAQNTANFVKKLVRIVAGHDGEIAIAFVQALLAKHGIKKGSNRDRKANQVMKLLLGMNWIVLRAESRWYPRQTDKSQSPGLARRYGIGPGLQHKFVTSFMPGDSLYQREKEEKHLLLQHHSAQQSISQENLEEIELEYARLKAQNSDVQPLSDEDRKELDDLLAS